MTATPTPGTGWTGRNGTAFIVTAVRNGIVISRLAVPGLYRDARNRLPLAAWLERASNITPPARKATTPATAMSRSTAAMLHATAHAAGMEAGNSVIPSTMIVETHANQMDDSSPIVKRYAEAEGPCGFASVSLAANTAYGRYLKAQGLADKGYPTGLALWVDAFGQSMQRKAAYAQAYAHVLRQAGITAYARTMMD